MASLTSWGTFLITWSGQLWQVQRVSSLIFVNGAKFPRTTNCGEIEIKETRVSQKAKAQKKRQSVAYGNNSNEISALDKNIWPKVKCLSYSCIAFLSIFGHRPRTPLGHFKQTH